MSNLFILSVSLFAVILIYNMRANVQIEKIFFYNFDQYDETTAGIICKCEMTFQTHHNFLSTVYFGIFLIVIVIVLPTAAKTDLTLTH